jgi:hypothetical protein
MNDILSYSHTSRYTLVDISNPKDGKRIIIHDNYLNEDIFDHVYKYNTLKKSKWLYKNGKEYIVVKDRGIIFKTKKYVNCTDRRISKKTN